MEQSVRIISSRRVSIQAFNAPSNRRRQRARAGARHDGTSRPTWRSPRWTRDAATCLPDERPHPLPLLYYYFFRPALFRPETERAGDEHLPDPVALAEEKLPEREAASGGNGQRFAAEERGSGRAAGNAFDLRKGEVGPGNKGSEHHEQEAYDQLPEGKGFL
eukprot:CAMPEP_0178997130 /NCGR_PEP_ID=MMETSP0795-20121207/8758_1 /TAXON_ID=88552 /ORGANISM="Amoebophrya sp., Strain Ameob2" /LENGTH=161 /DNA_ID=CAMNT_0020689607 /DNA_START=120 /DNA_END=606 /DNA_ORIENTATION=+